ncbi:ribonuclease J [Amylibacter sp. IMCC11727]|uniref:ribonuclease J n=1 Tax=Amylibacter sp. IMCC11727 TaxID=3039851 RepID=UPI00244DDF66|nr:ribonuclease J [Amylibacter sp. IMCC11727]WGI23410.1 ribonuclease J [Amylibacter sp. IMCC11727]
MSNSKRLIFLPLGGAGEIGMNMYLYGYGAPDKERFILVDVGVTFPSMDGTPGVDLIMPDAAFIEARADRLDGIFITHAHEDHIGALGHLYSRLAAPIFTRKFTGAVARAKMEDHGQDIDRIEVMEAWPEQVTLGDFKVGFMPVSHSIPEASGLVIDSPAGRVVHTGDFKLDPDPIVGEAYNPALYREIAKDGVQALVCDSTNVFSKHAGKSESGLRPHIANMMKDASGMVVATTFASNVARLKTLAQAAVDSGRSVVVLGRSMKKMLGYANFAGLIDDFPPIVDVEDAHDIPRENLMLLVTGSQGERRAASAQLANGKYLGMTMREGDTFLFSSKTIPGNEVGVGRIINAYSEMGVNVVDESAGHYHVSGHANRPDLEEIHGIFKPKMLIPMHGEHRHLRAHADLAAERNIPSVIASNGAIVNLSGDTPDIESHIETGRIYLDGSRLIGAYDGVVLERMRMALRGAVVVSLLFEDNALIGESWAEVLGLPDTGAMEPALQEALERSIDEELVTAKKATLMSDDEVERLVTRTVSRVCKDLIGKKPVVKVLINRLVD